MAALTGEGAKSPAKGAGAAILSAVPGTVPAVKDLSPQELSRRVAILKRFRALLSQQRDRFQTYLETLDKQKDVIETGSAEELLAHVELEEKIVADIFSIQKVIDPLEEMYRAMSAEPVKAKGSRRKNDDVLDLKSALEDLKGEAAARSTRNKELLSRRMAEIRSEIKALRSNPYAARRSSFSTASSLIDIKG